MEALLRKSSAAVRLITRHLGARGDFEPTHWVWSRGLALLCNHHGGVDNVRNQRGARAAQALDPQAFAQVRDGDLVWVRLTALPQFVDQILPTITARFALVSGDEDWSIPGDFERAREIWQHPNVLCWFSQNFDGTERSGAIQSLPIGLDFHTISLGRRWGHAQATPTEQERWLEDLRRRMPPNGERLLRVHADFHFNRHRTRSLGETREQIEIALRANPSIDFQPEKVSRQQLWRTKTRYAFVVSPHGNGLDCHRTWESLALDNIVIVKRSALDLLYEGLPVVIVDDWRQISAANLARWHQQYQGAFGDPEVQRRLTSRYWIERIRTRAQQRLAERRSAAPLPT